MHRQEVDRGADVLVGERALVLVVVAPASVDPHDVEVERVHVARVARDRLDAVELGDGLVVEREVAPADLACRSTLSSWTSAIDGEHVGEVRLVAGDRDVVERAVAAPHHAQVVDRRGERRRRFVASSPPSPAATFFVA